MNDLQPVSLNLEEIAHRLADASKNMKKRVRGAVNSANRGALSKPDVYAPSFGAHYEQDGDTDELEEM